MARRPAGPARTLTIFFISVAVLYGLVALGGSWKPALGLDLEGGTRIRLAATGNDVTAESLSEAADIIDNRVNGSGVSEAEVTTEGNQYIVVEIPGQSRRDLVDTVKRQAQLRFRVVAMSGAGTAAPTAAPSPSGSGTGSAEPTPSTSPGGGVLLPSDTAEPTATASPTKKATGKNRPPFLAADDSTSADPSATASPSAPPARRTARATPDRRPTDGADRRRDAGTGGIDDPLTWMDAPDEKSVAAYNAYSCSTPVQAVSVNPKNGKTVPATSPTGRWSPVTTRASSTCCPSRWSRAPTSTTPRAGIPQNDVNWVVSLDFNGDGTDTFAEISRALYGTQKQFAIVLDGVVISAPTMDGIILNGQAQISGNFNQASAESLATSLRYGSLPISFEKDPTVETIGPSLAGDQLSAGIFAGLIGLLAVMLYCLLYYRGLGVVVIASLLVAAAITYAIVLLLAKAAGFTLTLPGIAGLIVAVGITADSFIVYFERIRDEMRDGKSMRVAVEAGWKRARNTCLAADAVSLLAAVVLYIFAAGVVRGFAFALGISTVIDLVVFFWFTHPMVSWLARFRFFNQGHKLSGLDAEALGIDQINLGTVTPAGQTVGGRA